MSHIIEITDFDAPELDVYARLTETQLLNRDRPEEGMFIAESPKVIERALDAGYEPVSFLAEKAPSLCPGTLLGEAERRAHRCSRKCNEPDEYRSHHPTNIGAIIRSDGL